MGTLSPAKTMRPMTLTAQLELDEEYDDSLPRSRGDEDNEVAKFNAKMTQSVCYCFNGYTFVFGPLMLGKVCFGFVRGHRV